MREVAGEFLILQGADAELSVLPSKGMHSPTGKILTYSDHVA